MTALEILNNGKRVIDEKCKELLFEKNEGYDTLLKAMDYSVAAGGKRLRPSLMLEFYRLCGGKYPCDVANFAASIEFIHSYSLIHDDLPCMDNDDLRRGKPSCHIAFGEDTALLAGDSLLTLAFFSASQCVNTNPTLVLAAINKLSEYAGIGGMVGGQVIDLAIEGKDVDADSIKKMYSMKTGALIKASCEIGCILAGASDDKTASARTFAENIGLAFQIVDDLLDLTGDAKKLGKPVGSDDKNDKSTYVSKIGIEKAEVEVVTLTNAAIDALEIFGDEACALKDLAKQLISRKN